MTVPAWPSVRAFYDDHSTLDGCRRELSREFDFGVWWSWTSGFVTLDNPTMRVTLVGATGELIAVETSHGSDRVILLAATDLRDDDAHDAFEDAAPDWADLCGRGRLGDLIQRLKTHPAWR